MPNWEIWIIPLIALSVWILGTLFKPGEDDRTKRANRRPGSSSSRPPVRRPVTDLDRFLEEARRRREAEEKRKVPAPSPATPRVPLSERPSRNLETPSRPVPTARRAEELPVVIPVARPVPQPTSPREAASEAALVVPCAQPVAELPLAPPPPPVAARDTRPTPILQQVRSLLSKPQSAGAAFVLREIFDRPRCMRRR